MRLFRSCGALKKNAPAQNSKRSVRGSPQSAAKIRWPTPPRTGRQVSLLGLSLPPPPCPTPLCDVSSKHDTDEVSSKHDTIFFWVLEASLQLVAHLSLHAGRQHVLMLREKASNRCRVPRRERAQRPAHRLHHHVFVVADEHLADHQRPLRIPGSAARLGVQHHGRNQR